MLGTDHDSLRDIGAATWWLPQMCNRPYIRTGHDYYFVQSCPSQMADDPPPPPLISSSPSIPEDASGHFVNKTRLFFI